MTSVEGLQHVSKGMIQTSIGSIGYLECNPSSSPTTTTSGSSSNKEASMMTPIICFHSSPRSSDEYLEVLPLLSQGSRRRVIAFDNPGYGISENPIRSITIDDIADAFIEAVDKMLGNKTKFVLVGCLMGNFILVSIASRYPDRVSACIVANLYYYPTSSDDQQEKHHVNYDNKQSRRGEEKEPIIDSFELKEDGTHLVDLHNKRSSWLDPELNFRVVQTEISYLVNRRKRYSEGISIEDLSQYDFETPASTMARNINNCPILCIRGDSFLEAFDLFGLNGTERFESGVNLFKQGDNKDVDVEVVALIGKKSTLNMINQLPTEFANSSNTFLEKHNV